MRRLASGQFRSRYPTNVIGYTRKDPLPVHTTPRRAIVLLLALATVALGACSSDASTRAAGAQGASSPTAAPVTVPDTIPEGTTLRIGDQLDYLKTVLSVAGEDADLPYEVEYSNFVGGPPMLQAFQGGALDGGFVASTPLIFAQAAGQPIVAVAGWANEQGLGGLITTDAAVSGWEDLEGRRVAYQRGTSAEAALLIGLDEAGLSLDDVTTVDVPITQVTAALQSGSADAGISTEPLISSFLANNPEARLATPTNGLTDRGSFLIATAEALGDPARTAALADYTARLVRAFTAINAERQLLIDSIFVGQYGLSAERAAEIVGSLGDTSFLQLPDDIVSEQQRLADLFHAAGQIPSEVDVAAEFDNRFNQLIEQESNG